jgi:hypothetical protein
MERPIPWAWAKLRTPALSRDELRESMVPESGETVQVVRLLAKGWSHCGGKRRNKAVDQTFG